MFGKWNPFGKAGGKPQSDNPLEMFDTTELRTMRFKLDHSRDDTLKQIRQMEEEKERLMSLAAQSDQRTAREYARRVVESEQQIRFFDQQLVALGKHISLINRFITARANMEQMKALGLDQLLKKIDPVKLRVVLIEGAASSDVNNETLDEIFGIFDDVLGPNSAFEDGPEVQRVLEDIERMRMGDVPKVPAAEDELRSDLPPSKEPPAAV